MTHEAKVPRIYCSSVLNSKSKRQRSHQEPTGRVHSKEQDEEITVNGQPALKGKNFLETTRGERWEFVSPSNKHLSGKFVSRLRRGKAAQSRPCGCSANQVKPPLTRYSSDQIPAHTRSG
jgi:hypothetical protein